MTACRLAAIAFPIGVLLTILALAEMAPAAVDAAYGNPDWSAFATSSALTLFIGLTMSIGAYRRDFRLSVREAFLLTVGSWVCVSVMGALPFSLAELPTDWSDAVFESVSGLTTTGSTVLAGLDAMPPGILLWRGLLQWLGGIGIIAMAVLMLPFLRVGGMQLFRMESSDQSEKVFARSTRIISGIAIIYLILSIACAAAYYAAGMTGFEAIVHAMTTISTGGYSTSDASMGHFESGLIDWIAILFMTAGSIPFVLYLRMLGNGHRPFWRDSQVQFFMRLLAAAALSLTAWLWARNGLPLADAVTLATFNVVSVVTTTGYATGDYTQWGAFPVIMFFVLTALGGCTGSTAGGLKALRLQVALLSVGRQLKQLIEPHRVVVLTFNGRPLQDGVVRSVMVMLVLFGASVAALTLALGLTGLDLTTSLSGALTAVANVGPGLGSIIGPAGNFAALPDSAEWLLAGGMLVGRLEYVTVFVLLSDAFWHG